MQYLDLNMTEDELDTYILVKQGVYFHVIPEVCLPEVRASNSKSLLTNYSVLTICIEDDTVTKSRFF
jgi:hypothetical protein